MQVKFIKAQEVERVNIHKKTVVIKKENGMMANLLNLIQQSKRYCFLIRLYQEITIIMQIKKILHQNNY